MKSMRKRCVKNLLEDIYLKIVTLTRVKLNIFENS